ncbi:TIGR04222 domain-containing membrane protein [Amycolatopsis saalfeldensis]|uniref:TIGR04222 domain-containing protein n=1 Tax=Amycolatopsis saalfeldensis TaxID=394193 RepID=A0A1H8XV73_9PSEU|nr:TIGR04222 domain-containing membrane protein [Amycolatopsis saalfeldensis]SEP43198.1 TIGR04222 domain-containing protein [Amycolatopsis saalfeldensis]
MSEPWGISGPQFLVLYGLALALLLVVQLVLPAMVRARARSAPAAHDGSMPGVYQLAYLAGGAPRAVDAAIAALVERGLLRLNSYRQLSAAGPAPQEPLERAVHGAANEAGRSLTTNELRYRTVDSRAVKDIEADLDRRGLLMAEGGVAKARTAVSLLWVLLLVVGVVRGVNGVALGRPVGGLVALVFVALVLTFVARSARRWKRRHRPTSAGEALVTRARADLHATERPEGPCHDNRVSHGWTKIGIADGDPERLYL